MEMVADGQPVVANMDQRCGRPTKRGTRCTNFPMTRGGTCYGHLTREERAEHDQYRQAQKAQWKAEWKRYLAQDPACWSWDPPCTVEEWRARQEREGYLSPGTLDLLASAWDGGFDEFHQGRCAICGRTDPDLVDDHDHSTGFRRGWLCCSCNVQEGKRHGGLFEKYRQRPPAVILGVRLPYTGYGWENGVPLGGWARYRAADDDRDGWKGAAIMAKIFDMADEVREDRSP